MANLNVTYSDLTDTAGRLATGKEDLNAKLIELKGIVDGLVESGFVTDTASGAFQTAYDTFTNGATQTISGLDGLSTFLTQAAETLGNVDAELGAAISG